MALFQTELSAFYLRRMLEDFGAKVYPTFSPISASSLLKPLFKYHLSEMLPSDGSVIFSSLSDDDGKGYSKEYIQEVFTRVRDHLTNYKVVVGSPDVFPLIDANYFDTVVFTQRIDFKCQLVKLDATNQEIPLGFQDVVFYLYFRNRKTKVGSIPDFSSIELMLAAPKVNVAP